jgi:hypothetical protein
MLGMALGLAEGESLGMALLDSLGLALDDSLGKALDDSLGMPVGESLPVLMICPVHFALHARRAETVTTSRFIAEVGLSRIRFRRFTIVQYEQWCIEVLTTRDFMLSHLAVRANHPLVVNAVFFVSMQDQ